MACQRAQASVKERRSRGARERNDERQSWGEGGKPRGPADPRARDPSADSIAVRLFLASLLARSDHALYVSGEQRRGPGFISRRKERTV